MRTGESMGQTLLLTILSGLPDYLDSAVKVGHLRIAQERRAIKLEIRDLREYAQDSYRTIDDEPYGGGAGMVLKPEPVFRALESIGIDLKGGEKELGNKKAVEDPWVLLPTPKGKKLEQDDLVRLSKKRQIVFVCSRYKGIDERIREWVDEEISLGDYVIGGGEAAALVIIEGITRLLEGVVGDEESIETDSHTSGMLSPPTYTRPEVFKNMSVPAVLLSGHHEKIRLWRRKQALALTLARRPDILAKLELNMEDEKLLSEVIVEQTGRN
ncbi:tRNA (guanosine(37)-N1)-methyltransferase TrmD [candidate division WOR-3 bacterium]|nr:tRNA (guanosine(37)-N1)-methyltransferase TrmD [candidate division WOR-3 bacterium]